METQTHETTSTHEVRPSTSTCRKRISTSCAGALPPRACPKRRPSQMLRRACSWRRCRHSRATGATEYDFRRFEANLKALPHFITEIDGLDVHFIHVRSKHEHALPLIVTHGWPGSVIELTCRNLSRRSMGSTFISSTFVRTMNMRCRSSSLTDGPVRSSSN